MGTVLLKPAEVSKRIHISEHTLRLWRREDSGPPFIIVGERTPRYIESELEQWVRDRKRGDKTSTDAPDDEVA